MPQSRGASCRPIHALPHQPVGGFRIAGVSQPERAATCPVRGPDTASGGANLLAALSGGVEELVVGEDQVGPGRNDQSPGNVDVARNEGVQLLEGRARDRPRRRFVGHHDARGNKPQDELGSAHDHPYAPRWRLPDSAPQISLLREHIDDFPFALVAPLEKSTTTQDRSGPNTSRRTLSAPSIRSRASAASALAVSVVSLARSRPVRPGAARTSACRTWQARRRSGL